MTSKSSFDSRPVKSEFFQYFHVFFRIRVGVKHPVDCVLGAYTHHTSPRRAMLNSKTCTVDRPAPPSPEIKLSSEWSRLSLKSGGRPVRSTRGKRTSLDTKLVDWTKFGIDSDNESDRDNEVARPSKKPRLQTSPIIKMEYEQALSRGLIPYSSDSSPSPEPEPGPNPWELDFYPRTKLAAEKFKKILVGVLQPIASCFVTKFEPYDASQN